MYDTCLHNRDIFNTFAMVLGLDFLLEMELVSVKVEPLLG
jgi:hypothetical protein